MNLKSKKGFTLVELIIVIAILGIIALIAVPNLTGIQQRSQVNADIRTAEQIGKAVRIWLTDTAASSARLGLINEKWVRLDDASLVGLSDYISTTYVPGSLTDLDDDETPAYWIGATLNEAKTESHVFVVIDGNEACAATTANEYPVYTAGTASGLAYAEGYASLTAGAGGALKSADALGAGVEPGSGE